MKSFGLYLVCAIGAAGLLLSCEVVDDDPQKHQDPENYVELSEVAQVLANIPIEQDQLQEVYDAVSASCGNGYDEEYTMSMLFESPGAGVGENIETRSSEKYERPLRDLIKQHVISTKSGDGMPDPEKWLDELKLSDIQIYWPYSENWDGKTLPIITFNPEDDSEVNVGYKLKADGGVEEVMVDEQMAMENPVWVVNRNEDASYKTLEMLRKENPEWENGGGEIIVTPSSVSTKAEGEKSKCLILKNFRARRNFDCWFAGGAEFFIKTGSVKDFTATTEAELRLFNPKVTDFMIVVPRSRVYETIPFNAMLVSDWTEQLTHCAFMMMEDDGGTWTEWNCTALVRIASKSYGIEISLPIRSWDEIVWRGRIAWDWLEAYNGKTSNFGDVDLTFQILEY
jgi:hypothetical protein